LGYCEKRNWYVDANEEKLSDGEGKACERPYCVYRTPVNFVWRDSPFALYETRAEDVEKHPEELCYAKTSRLGKAVPLRDIGKISVRELMRSGQGADENGAVVACLGDACAAGEQGQAVSLKWGNAATSGEHAVAISLGDHQWEIPSQRYSRSARWQRSSTCPRPHRGASPMP
jgi:hypothetical protein